MDIVCNHCDSKFKLPDGKIPADKTVSIPCPKCKNKITLNSTKKSEPPTPTAKKSTSAADGIYSNTYDASEKPFDFVEEEGKTALVCELDPVVKKALLSALAHMDYHVTDAKDTRAALRHMRYHVYDLVMVNESFDTLDSDRSGVLGYLERLPMELRRDIFVTLITRRYRTLDNMMAFSKSVNLILNAKNIGGVEKILTRSITDHGFFYRVFNESFKRVGRI